MLMIERRRLILDLVRRKRVISVRDVAYAIGAAQVTVRRDLIDLERNGLLKRTHGGAMLKSGLEHSNSYEGEGQSPLPHEVAIAIAATNLVAPGDSIVVGAGHTTLALARELANISGLTVITNSLHVAAELIDAPGINLFVTGGFIRRSAMALVGPTAEQSLRGLRASIAFLSGEGLTAGFGLSTSAFNVATADRAGAAAATRTVVLVDHRKVGRDSLCQVVPTTAINVLITDSRAELSELRQIREVGVQVETASTKDTDQSD